MLKISENLFVKLLKSIFLAEKYGLNNNFFVKKRINFKKQKFSKSLLLIKNPKKRIKSLFFFLLFEIQKYFEKKKNIIESNLLDEFWFDLLPDRFFLSLGTFFLAKKILKKKKRGILFDPFNKILFGVFLLIKKKKAQNDPYFKPSQFLRIFSQNLIQKPEQEKQKLGYFLEKIQSGSSRIKKKFRIPLIFFLDKFKCSAPVILGKIFFSLVIDNTSYLPKNKSLYFCTTSYPLFFKRILPFNFFNSLLYSDERFFKEIRSNNSIFWSPKKNFNWKNFYLENGIKSSLKSSRKSKKKPDSFFTRKNIIFSPFNFSWDKIQQGFWLIDNCQKLKGTFGPTGPGIYDPFLDCLTLNYSSNFIFICQDSGFFQKKIIFRKKFSPSFRKNFLTEKFSTHENFFLNSSGEKKKKVKINCKKIFPKIFHIEKRKSSKLIKNQKAKKKH